MEALPLADQDAIASRLLTEIEDEQQWAARFAATTDGQWDKMVDAVRRDAAAGRVQSANFADLHRFADAL
ncbi:MAG TPA: hypothetical protein VM165_11110 [Planctomycetaceae bacterium]|nr:hypothetical protein [Planctomycetaceae bacterium]